MTTTHSETQLVAELNDLLQLDHDAVGAYTLAIDGIQNPVFKQSLIRFRSDHERHIRELTDLIEAHGGIPIQLSHLPTGPMKLAVQAIGNLGGDREVLLAFKSNEGQVRNKYHALADHSHSADVAEVLNRNAADEDRHYNWCVQALESLGAGKNTPIGRAESAFETVHGMNANLVEGVERGMMRGAESARRNPLMSILMVLAGVLLLRRIFR